MKYPRYRDFGICILALVFLLCPVSADEIYPTVTNVFFEKDGLPYNESVQFTVYCYGYACKSWDCQRNSDDLLARNGNFSPELVFTYHATCPQYGCRIFEPYFHAERNFGTYCNLEASTQGKTFSIRNFSGSPIPQNCTELQPYTIRSGRSGGYYNGTPEYDECLNEIRRHRDRCDQYLAPCDPVSDTECRGWSIDRKNVKETSSYRACMDTIDHERADCDRYLKQIDPSAIVMWKDSASGSEEPARRACKLRFTIPSDSPAPAASLSAFTSPVIMIGSGQHKPDVTYGKPSVATAQYSNPIESFYCNLLSLFGARC
jgi:hypothetical protein